MLSTFLDYSIYLGSMYYELMQCMFNLHKFTNRHSIIVGIK